MITVKHKSIDGTIIWFVLSLLPIINLYWYWKICKILAAHKKKFYEGGAVYEHSSVEGYGLYFGLILFATIITFVGSMWLLSSLEFGNRLMCFEHFSSGSMLILSIILMCIGIIISLYIVWMISELIDGHTEGVMEDNTIGLIHKKDPSGVLWFVIYLLGLVVVITIFIWLWKASKLIAGHRLVISKEEIQMDISESS